jgi:MFS family permease
VRGERWRVADVLRSPRTWAYAVGAAPAVLLAAALVLWSPFAKSKWGTEGIAGVGRSWWELKRLSLDNLVGAQRLDLLLTWPLIALAPIGLVWLARRAPSSARWLVLNAVLGAAILFLYYGDAYLARIYLPSFAVLYALAAAGVVALGDRFGPAAGAAVGATVIAFLAGSSWSTLLGRHLGPLFVQKLYDQQNDLDHRHVDDGLYGLLAAEMRPGDRVAAFGDKAVLFKLLDRGVSAREDYLEGPRAEWPRWIVAATNVFERSPHFAANGGPYVLRARDTVGRHGLYELR